MSSKEDIISETDFSPLEREAADWLIRQDQGLSSAQRIEFERWCAASPSHAKMYAELEDTWNLFGGETRVSSPHRILRMARWALPLAAALTLGFFVWWSPAHTQTDFAETAVTEIGELQNLVLPDGSKLLLNSNSAVRVFYTAHQRRVKLVRGEAHFSVAKNPSRPFVAEIGSVAVRAVGTAFNISLNTDNIEVIVTEGNVRVDDSVLGESLLPANSSTVPSLLNSGERMVIPISTFDVTRASRRARVTLATLDPREIQRSLAWHESRLEFVAAPLAEIVKEFNRYNHHKLVIADPLLGTLRFGGNFRAKEPATFVGQLKQVFPIVAEERGNVTILHQAPQ